MDECLGSSLQMLLRAMLTKRKLTQNKMQAETKRG
jgi:hypothetical protein